MSSDAPSTREPRRRGKQGETRAKLIHVTIELVRNEGLAALTTSRITREAGIAQPGFYAHFKNIEDVLRTAVAQVIEDIRRKTKERRRNLFNRIGADPRQAIRSNYEDMLNAFMSEPVFAELLLRYRRDNSLLGKSMRRVM